MTSVGFALLVISFALGVNVWDYPVPIRTVMWKISDAFFYVGSALSASGVAVKLWSCMP